MAYLLDTNVISESARRRADPNVLTWLDEMPATGLFLSVIVVGEIRRGVEKLQGRGDTTQAGRLDRWLRDLEQAFADRIVPVTVEVAQEWGRLTARHTLPFVDGLLAATASTYKWTLVTRNVSDFAGTGVPVINPFDARPA